MERIPLPPPCERCGGSVGLWEAILVAPGYEGPTTWLALSEGWDRIPERILHHVCAGRDRGESGDGDRG